MNFKIIGVYDRLLRLWMPFQCVNDVQDEDIIESHRRAILTGKMMPDIVANGELYYFGKFDDKTGKCDLLPEPSFLVSFAEFLPAKKVEVKEDVQEPTNNA